MSFRRDSLLIILGFMWTNGELDVTLSKIANLFDINKLLKAVGNNLDKLVFSNKCLADLGCFFNGPPFYNPLYRPISLHPFDLNNMNTKFWLFTRSTPSENKVGILIVADAQSFEKSGFEKNLTVKFLIHGYLVDLKDKENDNRYVMKNALLKEGAYNVIIVDWTASNKSPYLQAVANARVVGAQVAQMINFFQKEAGIDPKNVHLIGHSLGAHVSGWAGERIPNLGRISGLDPAGPYFQMAENEIRLDETDTDFLDVIHSNAGKNLFEGLGIEEAIGDLDFYPNGGQHQPGCQPTLLSTTVAGINITIVSADEGIASLLATSCDHSRALKLYTATIDASKCTFMGTQCENYDKFKEGKCKDGKKVKMGYHAKKDPKIQKQMKYYLITGSEFPFCTEQMKNSNCTNVKCS